jgi:hypothetical protein
VAKEKPRRPVLIAARLITAVVSLLGAEAMLWMLGYPSWRGQELTVATQQFETDRELGWKNREGVFQLTTFFRSEPFRHTTWSGGRRATSGGDLAEEATVRPQVQFFGDSYVEGYGLADSETFAWIFQKRHPELKVSNFGTSFYATYQSYLSMKRSARVGTVYYLLNGFHEGRNVAEPSWTRIMKPPPAGFFFPYAELSRGALQARESWGEMVWPLSRRMRTVAMVEDYVQMAETYTRVRNKRLVTEMLLAQMDETVRSRGGKFSAILFDLSPEQRKSYRAYLQSKQIAFVDCDHPELSDRSLRFADGHPNQRMNELLAGWIEPAEVTAKQRR